MKSANYFGNDDPLLGMEQKYGTFDIIEFNLSRQLKDGTYKIGRYGINVSKVREVVRLPKINPLSSNIPGVAGVFELRGVPIPAINLTVALGDKDVPIKAGQQVIVAEFSNKRAGFIVDQTDRIQRVAWESVLPAAADSSACISGMLLLDSQDFLFILDLEKIIYNIESIDKKHAIKASGELQYAIPTMTAGRGQSGSTSTGKLESSLPPLGTVMVIDDSQLVRQNIVNFLKRNNFKVIEAENGQDAKEMLENQLQFSEFLSIDLVVTDVEMPKMDGISLCRWIKGMPQLAKIPVLIHSSLSAQVAQKTGLDAGADGYVVKNNLGLLGEKITEIFNQKNLKIS